MQYADGTCEKQIDTVEAVTDVFAGKLNLGSRQHAVLRGHPLKITSFEEQSDMKKKESPKRNTCRVQRNVFLDVEGIGF